MNEYSRISAPLTCRTTAKLLNYGISIIRATYGLTFYIYNWNCIARSCIASKLKSVDVACVSGDIIVKVWHQIKVLSDRAF